MQQVMQTPGAKLLYTGKLYSFIWITLILLAFFDTDSIIVQHAKGIEPIKSGQMLGEMQREYEDWHILEYACGGAKQYGLHLKSRKNGEEKFILRIRVSICYSHTYWYSSKGITLDKNNCQQFQYAHFRDMVLNFGTEGGGMDPANFIYDRIQPKANSRIVTRRMTKRYLPVLHKGLINEELTILPFGYEWIIFKYYNYFSLLLCLSYYI